MTLLACVVSILLAAASKAPHARPVAAGPASGGPDPSSYASEDALAHYAQGRLAQERGEDETAISEYFRVLAIDPRSYSATRSVSELAARQGEAARSLEFANRALTLDPADARALWLKGSAQFNLGRGSEAIETLEAATRADSDEVQYWLTLAHVAENLDRIPIVERAYSQAVRLDEDDAEAWFQLAAAAARLADYTLADSALTRAAQLNPMRPGQVFLKGWIRESTGHPDEAITLYRRHLELHPDDQVTRGRLVDLLTRQKRYAEGYTEAQRLSRARPGDPDALEAEADLAYKLNRPREGGAALDRMRRIAPDDPALVARSMAVLGHNGRGAEAVTAAEAWARAHPGNFRGELLVAQAMAGDNRIDAAIEHAQRAVATAPDSLGPRVMLGRIYQGEKRFAEAEKVWVEALARFPKMTGLGLDLAYCREQQGNVDGAEAAVRDVLKSDPESAAALNFLGYLLADHNRKLAEAESLIRRAVEQEPDNGAYLDSMGWVYYRMGRLQEARSHLERAAELTHDPVVYEHLGDVYKDLKLFDLARDQYTRALERDSSNARVRAKLAQIR
ncbi:MAG TPA: tetratricopeptide repeat protein [Candidatus Eisenbacteria bacterium]